MQIAPKRIESLLDIDVGSPFNHNNAYVYLVHQAQMKYEKGHLTTRVSLTGPLDF